MSIKSFLGFFFGTSSRLSDLERRILNCVRSCFDEQLTVLWDKQVGSINKIQRLPNGIEVDFYRMKNGRPSFDPEIAFPNRTKEILLAKVEICILNAPQKLNAWISCVRGFLFSIQYDGDASYFEEAAGLEDKTILNTNCELIANIGQDIS